MNFILLFSLFQQFCGVYSIENGIWNKNLNQNNFYVGIKKSMYKDTQIFLDLECDGPFDLKLKVQWLLRSSSCYNNYQNLQLTEDTCKELFLDPFYSVINSSLENISYKISSNENGFWKCGDVLTLKDETTKTFHYQTNFTYIPLSHLQRRDWSNITNFIRKQQNKIVQTWKDSAYFFILHVEPLYVDDFVSEYNISVKVEMKSFSNSYLSQIDWPLLPFYMAMCIIYALICLTWLIVCSLYWQSLMRIQYWIGAVIILGLLEKTIYVSVYDNANKNGFTFHRLLIFAEIVSAGKRSLSRILVIIMSLGFGIVKPRLGTMLSRVSKIGIVYFILASIEGTLRLSAEGRSMQPSSPSFISRLPITFLDTFIFCWVFTSLSQTIKTLKLRHNVVKLSVYRHFTNALIFSSIASIIFMLWVIKAFILPECTRDFYKIWVDDIFWKMLFTILLIIIIILWRPTANNQKYAFTPLLDNEDEDSSDDDSYEHMLTERLENDAENSNIIKNRAKCCKTNKNEVAVNQQDKSGSKSLEWVEKNIPPSLDIILPDLIDIERNKEIQILEMSKMQ